MIDQMTTREAIHDLVRMHHLLWRAEAEARVLLEQSRDSADRDETTSFRFEVMAGALAYLAEDVHQLFPVGVVPAFDGWPLETTGADPIELARQAEQLTRNRRLADFPLGMGGVIVRILDTIRDFS